MLCHDGTKDVLIQFAKVLKEGNKVAQEAQLRYQQDNDQRAFLSAARTVLESGGLNQGGQAAFSASASSSSAAGGKRSGRDSASSSSVPSASSASAQGSGGMRASDGRGRRGGRRGEGETPSGHTGGMNKSQVADEEKVAENKENSQHLDTSSSSNSSSRRGRGGKGNERTDHQTGAGATSQGPPVKTATSSSSTSTTSPAADSAKAGNKRDTKRKPKEKESYQPKVAVSDEDLWALVSNISMGEEICRLRC